MTPDSDMSTITTVPSTVQTQNNVSRAPGRNNNRQGRGGAGRGNNRNSNYNNNRNSNRTSVHNPSRKKSSFQGNTAEMNGHVFECYEESGIRTQFSKTVEVLGEYISKKVKFPEDMKSLWTTKLAKPSVSPPADLANEATATKRQLFEWEEKMKIYFKRQTELEGNLMTTYSVIWGQCSEAMRTKLRAVKDFSTHSADNDCSWILKEIKGVTHQFDTTRDVFMSLLEARIAFYTCKQENNQSLDEYLDTFSAHVDVLEYYGADVSERFDLIPAASSGKAVDDDTRKAQARGRTLAMALLRGADRRRYGELWTDLANQQARNNNQYPTDLIGAFNLLVNFQPRFKPQEPRHQATVSTAATASTSVSTTAIAAAPAAETSGHTFAQAATTSSIATPTTTTSPTVATAAITGTQNNAPITSGSNGVTYQNITCNRCNQLGHYANFCP
jgi:hypothetical protein